MNGTGGENKTNTLKNWRPNRKSSAGVSKITVLPLCVICFKGNVGVYLELNGINDIDCG